MAEEHVPQGEVAGLHERIGRDVTELRARWRRWRADLRRMPDELVGAALETLRIASAIQGLVSRFSSSREPPSPPRADSGGGPKGPSL